VMDYVGLLCNDDVHLVVLSEVCINPGHCP
jgi:hypothetical protein